MMRSLQVRLLAGTLTGAIVLLAAAGILLDRLTRAALLAGFDATLAAKAQSLALLVEEEDGRIDAEFAERNLPEFNRAERPEYYELRSSTGRILACSPSLGHGRLEPVAGPAEVPVPASVVLPDGRAGRKVSLSFLPKSEDEPRTRPAPVGTGEARTPPDALVLTIARDTRELDRTLAGIRWILAGVGGGTTAVLCALLVVVVRRGLRSVHAMADRIRRLDESSLSVRLDAQDTPRELSPVVARLNELLGRLDNAFQRERTLTSDIAHELRTPLAGIRSTLEVALTREREAADYRQAMKSSLEITFQMQTVVENLLTLARAEAGQLVPDVGGVDLGTLLEKSWQPFAPAISRRGVSVRWSAEPRLTVRSDADRLGLVLRNLFDNAASYVDDRGEITVETVQQDGHVSLAITNTGSRIAPGDLHHVFDRFWRGDRARRAAGLHCGLGLSLSRRITELLGGRLGVDLAEGDRFRVRLDLPLAEAPRTSVGSG
jgi:signal transduction histidine kinase